MYPGPEPKAQEAPDDVIADLNPGPGSEAQQAPNDDVVIARRLSKTWSDALAEGSKPFESQRYRSSRTGHMAFCKAGALIVFSASGATNVAGVAVLAGEAVTGCRQDAIPQLQEELPTRLRGELHNYLKDALTFDYVRVSTVYDLRGLAISWKAFATRVGANLPRQWAGYPRLRPRGRAELCSTILRLCAQDGVVARTLVDEYL